jgi:crotonobetainyl-CoA:carnitine CoA-transferase CaiB-like acyl-CoA transferase
VGGWPETPLLGGPHDTTSSLVVFILADLGAEVIKIEKPGTGDGARGMPPHYYEGESAYFIAFNRNKKSIVLDLKSENDRNAFYELVKISDVVVDNYRPGVLDVSGRDKLSQKWSLRSEPL